MQANRAAETALEPATGAEGRPSLAKIVSREAAALIGSAL
jgi:hypothetical protein